MKASRKLLSLPIISLQEGQHIGYVKNLVFNPQTKSLAAIIVDKGFFRDQRIIPYNKVVSVGEDAITIDKSAYVEKSTNIPEILDLIRNKLNVIGTKIITESGKTLGIAEEYYINPKDGKMTHIEISGGKINGIFNGKARLKADNLITIGHDIIVAVKGSEIDLTASNKGINDTLKTILHSTTNFVTETKQSVCHYLKKEKQNNCTEEPSTTVDLVSNNPDLAAEECLDNKTQIIESPGDDKDDSSSKLSGINI
ncbi:MAG TPA: PRC-barrel domain-containing protein [Desulfitobacteriaceae bacterium]|nr:PRC-barrel domain-containing protein [Desulfitobacteriaceae bacterium]